MLCKKFGLSFKAVNNSLESFDGHVVQPLGSTSLPVTMNNETKMIDFIVVYNCIEEIILGTDFASQFGISINFANNMIKSTIDDRKEEMPVRGDSDDKSVPVNIVKNRKKNCYAYAKYTTAIPPHTAKMINIKTDSKCEKCIVKPLADIKAFDSFYDINNDLSKRMFIYNNADQPKYIVKNQKLAELDFTEYDVLQRSGNKKRVNEKHNNTVNFSTSMNECESNCDHVNKIKINNRLNEVDKNNVLNLLRLNKDRFSEHSLDVGCCEAFKHPINTGDSSPISSQPFRMSKLHEELLKQTVHDLIDIGVLRPSDSNWSAAAFLVKKPHLPDNFDIRDKKNYRLVVDYRAMNAVTKSDLFPIPIVQSAIEKLAGCKYFSKFDVNMAFHQLAIDENSKEKTAFVTPFGLFEYNRLSMGLKNSPATFQRAICKIIAKIRHLGIDAFLDDLIIATKT
ncbi:polymerase polyprotein-like protein [Leptotrombidium deliense]|uniref:Polymerase polyprotein-like protein n=1 Tax=Leptotrombidium deliense TaxID=299467 RepID=A0A443SJV3_9ACAR|nr:polymerase polyprotein-like protein [Leptotrombidium deliense]